MQPMSVATLNAAANAVHDALGPGLSEVIYQTALAIDLRKRGCVVEVEVVIPIAYQETYVGFVRADLVVNQCTVVEVKAVAKITEAHMLQLENYMRWLPRNRMFQGGGGQGAVVNFGKVVSVIGSVADPSTPAVAKGDEEGDTTAEEDEGDTAPRVQVMEKV
jgi:GxxExxY protein